MTPPERLASKLRIPLSQAMVALAIAQAGDIGATAQEIEDALPLRWTSAKSARVKVHVAHLRKSLDVETVQVAPRYRMDEKTASAVLSAAGIG